ncbi:MAG: TlpA family protein disulfide reductase [Bacteroidales bacterium]|jgi:thiol-disulfide isomerase/thioredoxin|nr:TlpA family protein disulfide reductase [Bacteroidales bacterium]
MKKHLLITTLISITALFIFSCKEQTRDFRVEFDLKGIVSDQASITVFGLRDSVQLDLSDPAKPLIPVTDGKIIVSGTTLQDVVLRISLSQDRQFYKYVDRGYFPNKASSLWCIVGPGTNLKGSTDLNGKNFVDFYPTGDKENRLFSEFTSKYMPIQSRIGDIAVQMAIDTSLTETELNKLINESDSLEIQSDRLRRELIENNPSSIAALWLMEDMLVRSQIEPAELDPLLARVDPRYHDNYFYLNVRDRVEGAKLAAVGASCPVVEGVDVHGNPFNLQELRGKYVIIDFWGTWCSACLSGMLAMREFRKANADKLTIIGIANDKDKEKVIACMEKHQMGWTNLLQLQGDNDYVAKFNVQGFPTKILVDPNGIIVYRDSGESEEFYLEVDKIINKK